MTMNASEFQHSANKLNNNFCPPRYKSTLMILWDSMATNQLLFHRDHLVLKKKNIFPILANYDNCIQIKKKNFICSSDLCTFMVISQNCFRIKCFLIPSELQTRYLAQMYRNYFTCMSLRFNEIRIRNVPQNVATVRANYLWLFEATHEKLP